jgi:hypothetical protein
VVHALDGREDELVSEEVVVGEQFPLLLGRFLTVVLFHIVQRVEYLKIFLQGKCLSIAASIYRY